MDRRIPSLGCRQGSLNILQDPGSSSGPKSERRDPAAMASACHRLVPRGQLVRRQLAQPGAEQVQPGAGGREREVVLRHLEDVRASRGIHLGPVAQGTAAKAAAAKHVRLLFCY